MTRDQDKWIDIAIKPIATGTSVNELDKFLTNKLPAAVCQKFEHGTWSYEPNSEGEYIVRCHVPAFVGVVRGIIDHFAFEVVNAKEMPEGKEIQI